MSSTQASVRNVRTSLRMQREMTSGRNMKKNTDAGVRGGVVHSS